jgi:hypothetical protein
MSGISEKIQSLRQTTGFQYKKPDPDKLTSMQDEMWGTPSAMEYLKGRGLADETIKHFGLGYDGERRAIAIPIYKSGELINIKYRYLEPDKNKYTSEKGCETWLYNEDGVELGMQRKSLLVVEGEFDAMAVWQTGLKSVVSPASGKDSYGVWLELLDNIPSVYIAYDNDQGGKEASLRLAERLGVEKCFEINYPTGIKDANEYFNSYTKEDFKGLIGEAKPFYTYQFKGMGDIIDSLRTDTETGTQTGFIPEVEMGKDWLVVVSGESNVGKTSYVMNVAEDLTSQNIPTLVMPFERGVESVGKRFLQVKFDKTIGDFKLLSNEEWQPVIDRCVDLPMYFSVPKKDEITDTIIKAKRLFDTRVVIIDHLDYIVRHVSSNRESEISNTLQELKRVAEEHGIIMIIVTHIRKIQQAGSDMKRKPNIEDLKGSASLYQDPECVVMLNGKQEDDEIVVDIVKNKGAMVSKDFSFRADTGKMDLTTFDKEF